VARYNVKTIRPSTSSPVTTTGAVTANHLGGVGHLRDEKSELFLLAVSNAGANTFHESLQVRDNRYSALVRSLAVSDPEWTCGLLTWLRGPEGNMRTASVVGAAEFVKGRLESNKNSADATSGGGWNRKVVNAVLQRGDEPGEMLGYWTSTYGRKLPKPLKRGVADAVRRLYTEYALLKYDTESHGFRFGDVIELVHPSAAKDRLWQGDLFRYAIDRRHKRDNPVPERLAMIRANKLFREQVTADDFSSLLDHELLQRAGMTWEDSLSLAGSKVDKAKLWEAMIPSMGYMALLRNLRNFEEARISNGARDAVAARLSDLEQVKRSRQFPFRFWSAFKHTNGLQYAGALEAALTYSMLNIPELPGRTLVLVDTSGSMTSPVLGDKSKITCVEAAALFGVAIAVRNPGRTHLVGFASGTFNHEINGGASMLREVERFVNRVGEVGHGTEIHESIQARFRADVHDRIFIISDMQTVGGRYGLGNGVVPAHTKVYGVNLGGYRTAAMSTGQGFWHELGALTDATFKQVPLLERGQDAAWPWLTADAA